MKRFLTAVGLLVIVALPVRAHFIWIVPGKISTEGGTPDDPRMHGFFHANVIFSENLEPDNPKLLDKIAQTEMFESHVFLKDSSPTKWTKEKEAYHVKVAMPRNFFPLTALAGTCRYGVVQRGQGEPFLLEYHAKAWFGTCPSSSILAQPFPHGLALEIVAVAEKTKLLQVLWQGKPLNAGEVTLLPPGEKESLTVETDDQGVFELKYPAKKQGLYGVRVRHIETKDGEYDGKRYKEIRHYATLVFDVTTLTMAGLGLDRREPDPVATKLLAEARAARAQWSEFPGFAADLEVNIDGKLVKGKVSVAAKGKVTLDVADAAAEAWAKRQLASIVGHRIDNSVALDTPCAFADADADHPLGRMIAVLNDEFHSSYRIRDRQIIVVNRRMKDSRFTITVLENQRNEEKQFLPECFVVNTWDIATDVLKSSESFHHTWTRLGKFDLPLTLLVVTASNGKQEARSLKLKNHKLGP